MSRRHLQDSELLLFADGEALSAVADDHLAACPVCQARLQELEAVLTSARLAWRRQPLPEERPEPLMAERGEDWLPFATEKAAVDGSTESGEQNRGARAKKGLSGFLPLGPAPLAKLPSANSLPGYAMPSLVIAAAVLFAVWAMPQMPHGGPRGLSSVAEGIGNAAEQSGAGRSGAGRSGAGGSEASRGAATDVAGEAGAIPKAELTPGAAQAIPVAVLCSRPAGEEESTAGPISGALAARVFERYRMATPAPRSVEVDYLVPPELGGLPVVENLWPQAYREGQWNSRIKDALEDRLRSMVCSGKLDLRAAQEALAKNWIAAYRQHFQTEQPLMHHLAFRKDAPWE